MLGTLAVGDKSGTRVTDSNAVIKPIGRFELTLSHNSGSSSHGNKRWKRNKCVNSRLTFDLFSMVGTSLNEAGRIAEEKDLCSG